MFKNLMIKKIDLRWIKCFDDPFKQLKIQIDEVPKGQMKKLAKEYNAEIRQEGITEFFELDFGTLSLKFSRHVRGK